MVKVTDERLGQLSESQISQPILLPDELSEILANLSVSPDTALRHIDTLMGAEFTDMLVHEGEKGGLFSFPQAHRKPFGWKATTARCPCWSPRLPCSCSPLAALELYVNKTTITAIKLLILRSFQRKGLCNSGLNANSTTFECC